mmetsp:Transcript_23347/g.59766  ORF Transcript_23347/g.59766 Transcript_23347/m.59766 type:complete len:373 (-) Transcript_23347:669-1787(-)
MPTKHHQHYCTTHTGASHAMAHPASISSCSPPHQPLQCLLRSTAPYAPGQGTNDGGHARAAAHATSSMQSVLARAPRHRHKPGPWGGAQPARAGLHQLGDLGQLRVHLLGGLPGGAGLVGQAVLGAQLHDARADARVRVAGHGGVQVVLDLVVEAAKHPVDHHAGVDVARGHHLARHKVLVVRVDLHAVVALDEHKRGAKARQEVGRQPEGHAIDKAEVVEHRHAHPQVVQRDGGQLDPARLGGHGGEGQQVDDALHLPVDVRDEQQRPHQDVLQRDDAAVGRGHLLQQRLVPGNEGHGVNVGVDSGLLVSGHLVGGGVVLVVLVLPPVRRPAHAQVNDDSADKVVPEALLEDLVVQEVVCGPPALEEEACL